MEQWLTRISGGNEKIAQLIREKKFLFGGRILAQSGAGVCGKEDHPSPTAMVDRAAPG